MDLRSSGTGAVASLIYLFLAWFLSPLGFATSQPRSEAGARGAASTIILNSPPSRGAIAYRLIIA